MHTLLWGWHKLEGNQNSLRNYALMRTFTSLLFTILLSSLGFSQAKIMFHGTIGLAFHGGTQTKPIYLVLDNPATDAIQDAEGDTAGMAILSESEFNIVKWNIRDTPSGVYTVPFVSPTGGALEYVAASMSVSSAGSEVSAGSGSLEFSTYHHDDALATTPSDVMHMNQHPSGGTGGEAFAMDRFWIIDATGYTTKPSMNLSLLYDEDELEASMTETEMIVQRYNSDLDHWLDLNLSGQVLIDDVTNAISIVTPITDTDFYRSWTITSATTPLPIELLSFESQCKGAGSVELRWTTAAEINNSHFTLERSEDGIIWETFADMIHGAGNSSTERDYSVMDNNPFRGLTYYRLSQTDFDGTSETFDPIVNDCDGVGFEIISAMSNQASDKIQMVVSAARDEAFNIEVLDMSGKSVLLSPNVTLIEGLNYFQIDKSNLSYGMYVIKLQSENELMTRKILLN
jgi:hypothetical protein